MYCDVCQKDVDTRIIEKEETYTVCHEAVVVKAKVRICKDCEEELFDEELDEKTLVDAFAVYRKRHHLLLPDEITAIRKSHGLNQQAFAQRLGISEKTLRRYENGSVQSQQDNQCILAWQK